MRETNDLQKINHRKHQVIACAICAILGISSSVVDMFRLYPKLGNDRIYVTTTDQEFANSLAAAVLSHLRNAIRGLSTLILIILNVVMICLYRKNVGMSKNVVNSESNKKRRDAQKVLTVLALTESIFNLVIMSAPVIFYAMLYGYSDFGCVLPFISPLLDMADFSYIADCYMAFAVSKHFRKMIFQSVPCLKRFAQVAPTINTVTGMNMNVIRSNNFTEVAAAP